jgi:large repetitive protein
MTSGFPPSRLRGFHLPVRRLAAGAVVAALFVLAVPAPATAAPTPTVTITDVTVTEGTGGTVNASFTIQAAPAPKPCCTLQVSWATAPGSATTPADFAASSGTVSLTKTGGSKVVSVPVAGDAIDEPNETFVVNLTNLTGSPGRIGDAQGLATITDDDPLPVLAVNDVTVTEGNAGTTTATFTVTLSAASGRVVTLDWTTADDSAVQPSDFTAASGMLTFAPGDTSETMLVAVNGDVTAELDETFHVILSAQSNADLGDDEGAGTIVDDEGLPVIDIDDPTVAEGQSGTAPVSFSVTLLNPAAWPVTVDWSTAAGTAAGGTDYLDASGTVTFAPMDTSETVEITVNGDGTYEGAETLALDLSDATGAPIGDAQGIATITNDDSPPIASVTDVSKTEGNAGTSLLRFVVSLSGGSDIDASLDFATANITATAGLDYLAASGTLTIPAGAASRTVNVVVKGDPAYETDETLSLTLGNPGDAVIGDGGARGTITNDDKAPTTITLRTVKKPRALLAKGVLEPAKSGDRVIATLLRKRNVRFVRITAKRVPVRSFRDRDRDGNTDGSYVVTFLRPKTGGTYKILLRFNGTKTKKPCTRAKVFKLPRTS